MSKKRYGSSKDFSWKASADSKPVAAAAGWKGFFSHQEQQQQQPPPVILWVLFISSQGFHYCSAKQSQKINVLHRWAHRKSTWCILENSQLNDFEEMRVIVSMIKMRVWHESFRYNSFPVKLLRQIRCEVVTGLWLRDIP